MPKVTKKGKIEKFVLSLSGRTVSFEASFASSTFRAYTSATKPNASVIAAISLLKEAFFTKFEVEIVGESLAPPRPIYKITKVTLAR